MLQNLNDSQLNIIISPHIMPKADPILEKVADLITDMQSALERPSYSTAY